ncbi:Tyrosine kinase-like (TKL) protein [Cardiosporidium cionae]|uniref:Tyrosine kinase-like (TKL) protein n=1 Tax=Cardiosporidium cionae TaxID=476202 RepID=A0ABQ7J4V2_9APIC|nr:Tyrosine kinase-like (TKL) protein [Cardiosporidium cionae]|eukprot:KAF8819032.1 Tyrosine kinase-like (TKL) protein [Cardiosporidium cionae]
MHFNGPRTNSCLTPLPSFSGEMRWASQPVHGVRESEKSYVLSTETSVGAETNSSMSSHCTTSAPMEMSFSPTNLHLNSMLLEYPYEKLFKATDGFCEERCLGYGNHGTVFHGSLFGTDVAVKTLFSPTESGFEEEVLALSKFRHPNLVSLMGFARYEEKRLLVYEMLSAGDVQKSLLAGGLTWEHRLSIALDTATALCYLHNNKPRCIHRDLKTANILLSDHGSAKVADFGLSCLSNKQHDIHVNRASGTIGYADPLYVRRPVCKEIGVVNEATDIYSFGAVLLELLTRRPPASQNIDGRISFFVSAIDFDLKRLFSFVDTKAKFPPSVSQELAQLSLRCLGPRPRSRPNFSEIVALLRSIKDSFTSKADLDRSRLEVSSTGTASYCNPNRGNNAITDACPNSEAKSSKLHTLQPIDSSIEYSRSDIYQTPLQGIHHLLRSNHRIDHSGVTNPINQRNLRNDFKHSNVTNVPRENNIFTRNCARKSFSYSPSQQASHSSLHGIEHSENDALTTISYPYEIEMKRRRNATCEQLHDHVAIHGQGKFCDDEEAYFSLCLQFSERLAADREQTERQLRMEEERELHATLEASKRDNLLKNFCNINNIEEDS